MNQSEMIIYRRRIRNVQNLTVKKLPRPQFRRKQEEENEKLRHKQVLFIMFCFATTIIFSTKKKKLRRRNQRKRLTRRLQRNYGANRLRIVRKIALIVAALVKFSMAHNQMVFQKVQLIRLKWNYGANFLEIARMIALTVAEYVRCRIVRSI